MTTAQHSPQTEEEAAPPTPAEAKAAESGAAAAVGAEVAALHAEVARLTEEMAKYKDQWIRTAAELENLRKRTQRELEENSRYAVTGFARDMVEVLENLMRASESIPAGARESNELLKTLGEGVDLTLQELLRTFERYGITRLNPMGQKFDHNFHQAVVQIDRHDVPAGTVVQVVQAGYVIHDRLLRPAMVAVSKWVEPPQKVDTVA